MKHTLWFLLLILPGWAMAQRDTLANRYASRIGAQELSLLLHALASDSMEGRETGMAGQKRAANYLAREFQKAGFRPAPGQTSFLQPFTLYRRQPLQLEMSVCGKALQNMTEVYSTSSVAELQLSADGLLLIGPNQQGALTEANGMVLLCYSGDKGFGPDRLTQITASARDGGANALIVIDANHDALLEKVSHKLKSSKMSLTNGPEQGKNEFPVIHLSPASAGPLLKKAGTSIKKLNKAITANKPQPATRIQCAISISLKQNRDTVQSENVAAYLQGSDGEQDVVVITAHYDHLGKEGNVVYYGADDDGSGTASLVALAHTFGQAAADGKRPKRSIMMVAFAGEEKGLLGSEYYAEHPVVALKNTVCDLNIDMIGRWDPQHEKAMDSMFVYVIGSDKLSSGLHQANEDLAKRYSNIKLDYTFNKPNDPNRFYYRSDHYNFAKKGVPVIFYFTGVHADYHKPTDTPNKIMYGKMAHIVRHVFRTAWHLADSPTRITVDKKN